MKFLLILLTVVQSSLIFAANDEKAKEQVRLSLWYQGVSKSSQDSVLLKEKKSKVELITIPEELEKALAKARI